MVICDSAAVLVYPEFASRPNLPLAVRMVLEGDGSTTLMLRLLADSEIVAEVLPSWPLGCVRSGSDHLAAVFPLEEWDDLAIRHTRLRDRDGVVLSENLITYRLADHNELVPADETPFGVYTRRRGMFERRRMLAAGITRDEFGSIPKAAPGRAYEIVFSTGQRVLVHEVLSPLVWTRPSAPQLAGARTATREFTDNRPMFR